ncbi:P-loop containing nucleoside triphosphate hydrolase protein [Mytilinidion resinicola]|uniref:P-loop containing nucleoside triphosphate hydrolase protein n=1 Tax=Mytilinidion resinicola TaxID=574789 RepID=A0A6A6YRL4_9PEZI|nr:P-loop containing nucleoside triphosphate hydrolase protein [Mytilinidion resinicola]KAF2810684.1 P-loop containing nucleoside triphosphate hydrolase protein [Mytilinidion resinicola]
MLLDICVVCILGGPGAGKGTQCSILQTKFLCAHFSVGDMLRSELSDPDSPHRELILKSMECGRSGPKEINIGILQSHIQEAYAKGVRTFFLDGFPRRLDLAEYFEEHVAPVSLVLVLECPRKVMMLRALRRRRNERDNVDNTNKRINTFEEKTVDAIRKYEAAGKVVRVQADADVPTVSAAIEETLRQSAIRLDLRTSEMEDQG